TVTTGAASSLTTSSANLSGTVSSITSGWTVRERGFEWGESQSSLTNTLQSYSSTASWTETLDGLGEGRTYYYRAYVILQNGSEIGDEIYGSVRSFTTASATTAFRPWAELPVMNIKESGSYKVNSADPSQYYATHWCEGGEKAPSGHAARNYTVCFSSEHHVPLWVAAPRHSMYEGSADRSSYSKDPNIPASVQYSSTDTGGGCNKGHMLGSAERTSSSKTNKQVFYYSNIAPQLSAGFNTGGGGWNTLEDWVDKQVCSDTLYVVIGCYFEKFTDGYKNTVSPKTISFGGRDDVSMPTMFYYVLLRTKSGKSGKALSECSASEMKCAAFVRCHTNDLKGQDVTATEMMSVSELEKITGVTYFANLPQAPKSSATASDWGL
nr:DNA/RNA non-specific endonuclease [Bacteroidales bacterium]